MKHAINTKIVYLIHIALNYFSISKHVRFQI